MSNSPYSPSPRQFSKINFAEVVELITPEVYKTEDLKLSGVELNPLSDIVNTNIKAAANISEILSISAVPHTQTSAIDTINGFAQYFVKQNKLTNITPYLFETKILLPLSTTLANYDTSGEFNDYLSGNLLPKIRLFQGDGTSDDPLWTNITELSSYTDSVEASSIHNYLIDTLGWMYFLNTSADGDLSWEPSSFVLSSLNSMYLGKKLETIDGLNGFTEYLWRNYATCSTFGNQGLIPDIYVSSTADAITESSAGTLATYTSGTQKLENLLTLVNVLYSPLFLDNQDYKVRDAFNDYIDNSLYLIDEIRKGPLHKFETVMGYSMADVTDQVENIGLIYDIENVRDEHLQYIADLIGWKLRGHSAAKWRHQLRNAVDIYKRKGTIQAIQKAVDSLITDSVFDLSGKVQELWESYIPFLIWYALGSESHLFRDLTTWDHALANEAGVTAYSSSSLEENIKIVTDTILLGMYKKFPDNFIFHNKRWDPPRLYELDSAGCITRLYTLVGEPNMKPFHVHRKTDDGYTAFKLDARLFNEFEEWDAAETYGPLGYGVYMAGDTHPTTGERPLYLSATGDLNNFLFNYRGWQNFPVPPFEEVKYYRDSTVTAPMVDYLVDRLKCFQVREEFADQVGDYILSGAGVITSGSLASLNEFLMLFSSVQIPPNYNGVMLAQSNYKRNLLNLWNGKSSHLFVDFEETDFDFSKTTLEGDSRFALYEASRIAREFAPGHAITRVNLNLSASEMPYVYSGTDWDYAGFDIEDNRKGYGVGHWNVHTSANILGTYESSGVNMGLWVGPGGDGAQTGNEGRGGLNTFKRQDVSSIHENLLSSLVSVGIGDTPRRALRRRNYRYLLPKEGYYDRTGFNAPNSWDPSSAEHSFPLSAGELTLGYIPSAGRFHPVIDPVNPSGVWHFCEGIDSGRNFSGIDTSNTFPYRGLSSVRLNNDGKYVEFDISSTKYVDRGQTPFIYIAMHDLFEQKARAQALQVIKNEGNRTTLENLQPWQEDYMFSAYRGDAYWKNQVQSVANEAIASGLVLNSFEDYINFGFGKGVHKAYQDYCRYFAMHPLSLNDVEKTGGNIFGQIYGKGLYNCDFSIAGSAATTYVGDYIASSFASGIPISFNGGSGVFSTCAVAAYDLGAGEEPKPASGTYIASDAGDFVVPLSGTWVSGQEQPFNAEFRNPHILSGVEFCDISGAPSSNSFSIFKQADTSANRVVSSNEDYLIENTVIKCKSGGGLPRLRFDLSSYGERANTFIKDHKFTLRVKALVAEEGSEILGGGSLGVWIHTGQTYAPYEKSLFWSWTKNNKWEMEKQSRMSIPAVKALSHIHYFEKKLPDPDDEKCLGHIMSAPFITDVQLQDVKEKYFETFEIEFDTRNFTNQNNREYLEIIPVPEEFYQYQEQVHEDNVTQYYVEVFYVPNNEPRQYLLIDKIELVDETLREEAAIGTGFGLATSGIPFRPFVKEDKLYLEKDHLREVFKFYNGLAGSGTGLYATTLGSRNSYVTESSLEVSGGSRLNYRVSPFWKSRDFVTGFYNYYQMEFDN